MGNQTKKTQKAQQKKLANAMFGKQKGKKNKSSKTGRQKKNGGSPIKSIPGVMSSVSDGVNVGMVWKNSNQVRDHFNRRFEKVTDLVAASTAFALIQNFFLNPGNSVLFPVFSQIASTYEEFICHLLRFWYRGEEYMASGSLTSAGIVAMATNMDPDDSTFTNISQLENYEGSVSGPPFAGHFCHDVAETHKSRGRNRSVGQQMALNQYFVYSSANQAAPASSTSKFYDLGQFQVAINGCQAASPMGELWVEHEWTLIRRKQETPIGQQALYAHVTEGPPGSAASSGTAPLGTTGGILRAGSTIPIVSTKNTFTLPVAGTFLVALSEYGSITSPSTLSPGGNITGVELWQNNLQIGEYGINSGTNAVSVYTYVVSASGTGSANVITLSAGTALASGYTDLFVTQISGGATLLPRKPSPNQIVDAFTALCERFDGLEKKLSQSQNTLISVVSEPDTPFEEEKGTELQSSVHISRSTAQQLLRGLGLKK